jgi:hypothetical protein
MKVVLRNQGREVELSGRRRVRELLAELGVLPETVLSSGAGTSSRSTRSWPRRTSWSSGR